MSDKPYMSANDTYDAHALARKCTLARDLLHWATEATTKDEALEYLQRAMSALEGLYSDVRKLHSDLL